MIKKNILYSHAPSSYRSKHVKSKIKWSGNIIYKHTGYSNKKLHFILRTGGVTFSLKICMSFFVETHTPFCSTHIKGLRRKFIRKIYSCNSYRFHSPHIFALFNSFLLMQCYCIFFLTKCISSFLHSIPNLISIHEGIQRLIFLKMGKPWNIKNNHHKLAKS